MNDANNMTDDELRQMMVEEGLTAEEMGDALKDLRAAGVPEDEATQRKPESMSVAAKPGEARPAALARTSLNPAYRSALPLLQWSPRIWREEGSLMATIGALEAEAAAVQRNDLSCAEAMLINQAHLLDTVFVHLMNSARLNLYDHVDAAERFARIAFKAQAQCRASLETLAEIKNPSSVAFVKQANIANGPQQVNNGTPARAEIPKQSNELLEQQHEQWLDTRAESAAGLSDPHLATVGALNGASHANGKGTLESEQHPTRSVRT